MATPSESNHTLKSRQFLLSNEPVKDKALPKDDNRKTMIVKIDDRTTLLVLPDSDPIKVREEYFKRYNKIDVNGL